jgi:PAS domain S-box-containing protein
MTAEALQAFLAAIVTSSDDAIVSKDLNGIVQSWNTSAERIFGWTADEMIGEPITKIIPPDRLHEEPRILERIRSGQRVDHFQTVRVRKDGTLINISVTISPVRAPDGTIIGASKVARDITEHLKLMSQRDELLAAERAARAEAERTSRMKDEFLATLGHELRTPLNAILGWTTLLEQEKLSTDAAEGVEVIARNARVQKQLIEDLLDMSRIISGKIRLDVQRVDLAGVIEAALATVRPSAEAKGVRLHVTLDPLAGPVKGDPSRLQQVVWNLLSNAIKFTQKGGRVQVFLERVNSHVEITVADNGRGIKPEFLPHVFDRFRQEDASAARTHGGLGLGLSIVKQLVELHGGTVRAKSPGEGHGATFVVDLPLMVLHQPLGEEGPPRVHPTAPGQSADAICEAQQLAGVTVLVADDEGDAREVVQRLLENCEATVLTAGSAADALEVLRARPVNVLISDIGMPGVDGYELMRQVRGLPAADRAGVPAIALTAFARSEDRMRAMLAGFDLHMSKPIEPTELIVAVASLAKRSAQARQRAGQTG